MDILTTYRDFLPPPLRALNWRTHPLDGKLLLFERDTGLNVLLEGDETAPLQRLAPHSLLIAVTNTCNLTCPFCYRDLDSRSLWREDSLLDLCRDADRWGVLEVAFGGGEPTLFPHWAEFINELYASTRLAISFTTNGTLLTDEFLQQIAGHYGQMRVSLYEDNDWATTLARLTRNKARFGVNWLITPAELNSIDSKFGQLLALGVRDFLLLSYKGSDPSLHLNAAQRQQFSAFVNRVYQQLGGLIQIKLDVCWGSSLPEIPRLFSHADCGAGDDFLSITSDRTVKACSFQHTGTGIPFETADDLRAIWQHQRQIRRAARIAGCARLPDRGLSEHGGNGANINLAAVQ